MTNHAHTRASFLRARDNLKKKKRYGDCYELLDAGREKKVARAAQAEDVRAERRRDKARREAEEWRQYLGQGGP
jgi:hypothetical protein